MSVPSLIQQTGLLERLVIHLPILSSSTRSISMQNLKQDQYMLDHSSNKIGAIPNLMLLHLVL